MPGIDSYIDRRGSGSLKWDLVPSEIGSNEYLPLWVADMDFPAPAAVADALHKRTDHGIYGYADGWGEFPDAFSAWMAKRHRWDIAEGSIVPVPGVMSGIGLLLDALTEPGDGVIIQPPIYSPFRLAPERAGRRIIENPLVFDGERYRMDIDHLRTVCTGASAMILCNPHNPVGRVWTRGELEDVLDVCGAAGIPVIADEIHCDILLNDSTFIPAVSVNRGDCRIVSLAAPTKTFNLAGLSIGAAVSADRDVLRMLKNGMSRLFLSLPNVFAVMAAETAYLKGESWLDEVLGVIGENADYLKNRLDADLPGIRFPDIEGTYLAWIDFSSTGLPDDEIRSRLLTKAGVRLNHGPDFGTGGSFRQRLNLACSRDVLIKAADKIRDAFQDTV